MKKLLILLTIAFAGCAPLPYIGMQQSTYRTDAFTEVVSQTAYQTTYERCFYGDCTFYYFNSGVCTQIDKGSRQPDLIIENR